METKQELIIGYRIFFPDSPTEDYPDVDSAWARRSEYIEKTGKTPFIKPLRSNGEGKISK